MDRQHLAQILSSLRRTRPRVPFYRLGTHTTPTRWGLYRGLLKSAPGDEARRRIRTLFRVNRFLTSPKQTKAKLDHAYRLLGTFKSAQNGEPKAGAFAVRFERLAQIRREKDHWRGIYARELAWIQKLRNRPILTGGFLRPSLFNRPLPRMRNQPLDITMMINKRIKARARRQVAFDAWTEMKEDIKRECAFETNLAKMCGDGPEVFPLGLAFGNVQEWLEPMRSYEESLKHSFALDDTRANSKYTPEMLLRIKQARTERIANKTREHLRERGGEVLNATRRRLRKGAPAHVWAVLSDNNKRRDRVRREVGAGGYSQWMRTGVWGEGDEGKEENKEMLDRMAREIRRTNLIKRTTER